MSLESALAAEGVFAFFLESGFLAILLFGWNRVGKKLHFFSTLMVCLGAHFQRHLDCCRQFMDANSRWLPYRRSKGGSMPGRRSPSFGRWSSIPLQPSGSSMSFWDAGWQGAFLVISISAYYMLKNRHLTFARRSMKIGLGVAFVTVILQAFSGDRSGEVSVPNTWSRQSLPLWKGSIKHKREHP